MGASDGGAAIALMVSPQAQTGERAQIRRKVRFGRRGGGNGYPLFYELGQHPVFYRCEGMRRSKGPRMQRRMRSQHSRWCAAAGASSVQPMEPQGAVPSMWLPLDDTVSAVLGLRLLTPLASNAPPRSRGSGLSRLLPAAPALALSETMDTAMGPVLAPESSACHAAFAKERVRYMERPNLQPSCRCPPNRPRWVVY